VSADVTVRTLRLRVPAASAAEGEAFARAALGAAAAQLPVSGRERTLGRVTLSAPAGDPAGLGRRVAEGFR
jgi:hypothetical protein